MDEREEFIDWAVNLHAKYNHKYDEKGWVALPYEFHLRMVLKVAKDFKHVWENVRAKHKNIPFFAIECACSAHDVLEDLPISYNDIIEKCKLYFPAFTPEIIAEMIFACTNDRGRNRKEKHSERFYEGIRTIPGALFVKLCDRIANSEYSILTQSRMLDMYRKEHSEFVAKVYNEDYKEMFDHLEKLLNFPNK